MTGSPKPIVGHAKEPRHDPNFTSVATALIAAAQQGFAGALVLRQPISPDRRATIATRRNILESAMVECPTKSIRALVDEMLARYAHTGDKETALIRSALVDALKKYPHFAIGKAMGRFVRGEVKPDEIGGTVSGLPTPSQLCTVIDALLEPWRREIYVARKLLGAEVAGPDPTPEDRERTAERIAASAQKFREDAARREAARRGRDEAIRPAPIKTEEETRKAREGMMMAEYANAGVQPISQGGITISLSLLISRGWTIQNVGHESVLVAPEQMR